jgi:hypothetical protein
LKKASSTAALSEPAATKKVGMSKSGRERRMGTFVRGVCKRWMRS